MSEQIFFANSGQIKYMSHILDEIDNIYIYFCIDPRNSKIHFLSGVYHGRGKTVIFFIIADLLTSSPHS